MDTPNSHDPWPQEITESVHLKTSPRKWYDWLRRNFGYRFYAAIPYAADSGQLLPRIYICDFNGGQRPAMLFVLKSHAEESATLEGALYHHARLDDRALFGRIVETSIAKFGADTAPHRKPYGPTEKTRELAETIKSMKDQHLTWSQQRMATELAVPIETIRNAYRLMGWKWERADRVKAKR